MGRNNRKGTGPSVGSRILRWGLLVAFVACFFPVPVRPIKDEGTDSENYPCRGSLCGCRTAHQCWTSCCCTTPEERLAWAIENNVTPPANAILTNTKSDSNGRAFATEQAVCASSRSSPESDDANASSCPHCKTASQKITLIESETYCGNHETNGSLTPSQACSTKNEREPSMPSAHADESETATTTKSKSKPHPVRFVRILDTLKCHGMTFALDLVSQCVIPELNSVSCPAGPDESLIDVIHAPYAVYLAVSLPPPRA